MLNHTNKQTNKQTSLVQKNVLIFFLARYARTTRYEEAFLPEGKKRPHYYIYECIWYVQVPGGSPVAFLSYLWYV